MSASCCACVLVNWPGLLPNGCALRRRVSFAACLSQEYIFTELSLGRWKGVSVSFYEW